MPRNELSSVPGQLDLRFQQGSPFSFQFQMPDDQTGYTFAAEIRRYPKADDVAAEFAVEVDEVDGTLVTASLTAEDTAALTGTVYAWGLERLEDDFAIFAGTVRVESDVRRA